jgi:hypothetical protein
VANFFALAYACFLPKDRISSPQIIDYIPFGSMFLGPCPQNEHPGRVEEIICFGRFVREVMPGPA